MKQRNHCVHGEITFPFHFHSVQKSNNAMAATNQPQKMQAVRGRKNSLKDVVDKLAIRAEVQTAPKPVGAPNPALQRNNSSNAGETGSVESISC